MKGSWLGLVVLLVAVLGWNSGIVNSAVVPNGREPQKKQNPVSSLKYVEQTMEDYVELAEAYYAPAPNDAVREKRTINIIRNLANRTRAGFSRVTSLLRGGGSSGGSGGAGGTAGIRAFIGDLFTRILTFFTRLWDRITGLFNRGGGDSGSGSTGPLARLRTGATALFARLTGGGGGGGGGLGGLGALFGRQTTTESYPDFIYSTEKPSSTSTEKAEENDFPPDSENDFPFHEGTKTEGGYADSVSETKTSETKREGKDMAVADSNKAAEVSGGYPDFIPFPGDTDTDFGVRSAKQAGSPSIIPANLPLQRDNRHVVNSPEVLHLINGQRLVVV